MPKSEWRVDPSKTDSVVLKSVCSIIDTIHDTTAVEDEPDVENLENLGDVQNIGKTQGRQLSHSNRSRVNVLRAAIIHSGKPFVTVAEHCSSKTSFPERTFYRMKSDYDADGLNYLLTEGKTGRKSALVTHAHVLQQFQEHAETDEQSTPTNNCRRKSLKDGQPRERIKPMYHIIQQFSGTRAGQTGGGGKQSPDHLSQSTLWKYMPDNLVPPKDKLMICSDCTQREKDVTLINQLLGAKVFDLRDSRTIVVILGTPAQFLKLCVDKLCSDSVVKRLKFRYDRLLATQQHFQQRCMQLQLYLELSSHLQPFSCIVHADFGQSYAVGRSKLQSEQIWRKLESVTNYGVVLEYRFDEELSKETRKLYIVVFSPEKAHSGFHSVSYLDYALQCPEASAILKRMRTVHVFTDRARHFTNKEFATYVRIKMISLLPKCLTVVHHYHASKHGKSLADISVRFGKHLVDRQSSTVTGYSDPRAQMSDLNVLLQEQRASVLKLTGRATSIKLLWCEVAPQTTSYLIISDTFYLDSSHCTVTFRSHLKGDLSMQELFRFDNRIGILISVSLKKLKRVASAPHVIEPIDPDDKNICKLETYESRARPRIAMYKKIAKARNVNVALFIDGSPPESFHCDKPFVVSTPVARVDADLVVRGRGRPPSKSTAGKGVAKLWTKELIIQTVSAIAEARQTGGMFPVHGDFLACNQTYLWQMIQNKKFGLSLRDLKIACGFLRSNTSFSGKRKRTKSPSNNF